MINNFISMNGYGLFVWLSFGIVLISCSIVYYKTKKTLNKYEKEFLTELETLTAAQKKSVLEKSKITSQILVTSSKSN
jgi:heme exporter protein D